MIPAGDLSGKYHRKGIVWVFIGLILLLVIVVLADLIMGSVHISVSQVVGILFGNDSGSAIERTILFDFRLPKTIAAILAGSALSVSGLQMQTVFRNPLAGPDVLGVSSGASLGVAIVVLGFGDFLLATNLSYLSGWVQIMAAWSGAALVLMLVMFVSLRIRDITTILILGILFGAAVSAFVSIMQYFSPQSLLKAFVIWSMGNLGSLTGMQLHVLSISLAVGFVITLVTLKRMNVMLLGENYSKSLGVNIKLTRSLIFLSTSILSGSITAFCGPVAFIGIAVPHLARMVFRTANHFILLPACLILGSLIMLLADIASQLPGSGMLLPINSVTAMLGIPVVIWIIVYNRRVSGLN